MELRGVIQSGENSWRTSWLVLTLIAGGVAIGAASVVAIQKMVENNARQEITDGHDDDDNDESNKED